MPCKTIVSILIRTIREGSCIVETHLKVGTRSRGQVYAKEIGETVVTTRARGGALRALEVGLGS